MSIDFVDLSQLPDIISSPAPGVLISLLHPDGTWEARVIEECSPINSQGISDWQTRDLLYPTWQYHRDGSPLHVSYEDDDVQQTHMSVRDISYARDKGTMVRTLSVYVHDGQVASNNHVRIIVGIGVYQNDKQQSPTPFHMRDLQVLKGVGLNLSSVREDEWFHGTFYKDWFTGIRETNSPLMVHLGTPFAAAERILDIGTNDRVRKGTKYYVHRLRLKPDAKLHGEFIRDMNSWFTYWDITKHGDNDAFVYLNNYEQKGSSSMYVRADKIELLETQEHQFYPSGLKYSRALGKTPQRSNTSRFRKASSR